MAVLFQKAQVVERPSPSLPGGRHVGRHPWPGASQALRRDGLAPPPAAWGLRVGLAAMVSTAGLAGPPPAAAARSATASAAITATVVAPVAVRPARGGGAPGVRVEGRRVPAYSVRITVLDARSAPSHGVAAGSRLVMVDFQ